MAFWAHIRVHQRDVKRHGNRAEGNWEYVVGCPGNNDVLQEGSPVGLMAKDRFGRRGGRGTGAQSLPVLGAGRLVLAERKAQWGAVEWNPVPSHPPAATWSTGVVASGFWRIRQAAGSHWKGPAGTFYLEHSSTARPTRQFSNHLIKSQLLRLPRAGCNLSPSSTTPSITPQARSLHLLFHFPFSQSRFCNAVLHSTLRFCDTPQHHLFTFTTRHPQNSSFS